MMAPRNNTEDTSLLTVLKFIPALVVLVTIGVTFGVAQTQINRASTDIDELKQSHHSDHDALTEIRQDVRFIKEQLQEALKK